MDILYIIAFSVLLLGIFALAVLLLQKQKCIQQIKQQTNEERLALEALKEENEVLNMEIEFLKKIYRSKLLKLDEVKRNVVEVE